jgi:two-component system sensor histidine kinase YesM
MSLLKYKGTLVQQISIVFVLITVIPLTLVGWLQYKVSLDVTMNNNAIMLENITEQSKQHLEALFSEVNHTQWNIIDSEEIAGLLQRVPYNKGEESIFISSLLPLLESIKSIEDIKQVNWYPLNSEEYPTYNKFVMIQDYASKEWYRDAVQHDGKAVWQLEQVTSQFVREAEWMLTQYRLLKDKKTLQRLGIVGVSIPVQKLSAHMQMPNNLNGQQWILVSEGGQILAETKPLRNRKEPLDTQFIADSSREKGSHWTEDRGERLFVTQSKLETNGWSVLSVIPEKTLLGSMNVVRNTIIALLIGYFLLGGWIAVILFARLTKPITDLASWMKQVDAGNLVLNDHPYTGKGEIPFLFRSFQSMVLRLKEQISQIYESEQKKKELEFEALNYQIRPHFLYNTLDTIKWKAARGKVTDVVPMIEALSGMLRRTLNGNGLVTLRQEIEQVKYYVELEQYRHQDAFDVLYDIDEKALDTEIPKLLVQPLVENAIRHGVLNTDEQGFILLRIYMESGEGIVIEVLDNGPGFPVGYAPGNEQASQERVSGGIGLSNISKRLVLYYGVNHRLEWGRTANEETYIRLYLGPIV